MDAQLQELLGQHADHFIVQENGKIQCVINGHTLPPRYDAVAAFIKGPKFQKMIKQRQADHALKKYDPFIVQSKNFPLMLYCALTGQLMDKSIEAVKKHMQGKKFLRAKERFQNDEIDLKPEPSLESFGVRLPTQGGNGDPAAAAAAGNSENKHSNHHHHQQQNGTAMESDEAAAVEATEPAFWAPSEDEQSQEEEEEEEDSLTDEDQPGSMDPCSDAMDMEEDEQAVAGDCGQPSSRAAGGNGGVAGKQKHQHAGQQQQQKQQTRGQQQSKHGAKQQLASAAARPPAAKAQKRNVNRPSAAKKAKRS